MGTNNSSIPKNTPLEEELKKMKPLTKYGNLWIFENEKEQKQYEYQIFRSDSKSFQDEEIFAKELKREDLEGIASIHAIQRKTSTEWFMTEYLFATLISHPRYTLQEYLSQKKATLEKESISNLLCQISAAQKILGDASQFIGSSNIFTNDGKNWMLKPFEESSSFYPKLLINNIDDSVIGYPAPEEILGQKTRPIAVKVFSFGMLLLQLMLEKSQYDLYTNNSFNKKQFEERKNELSQQKDFSSIFIHVVARMLEFDESKRPDFSEISGELQKKESGISKKSEQILIQATVSTIKSNNVNMQLLANKNRVTNQEIQICQYIKQMEENLQQNKENLQTIVNQQSVVEFLADGYMEGSNQRCRMLNSKGQILYEGGSRNGKYEGFGILKYEKFEQLSVSTNYNYLNLTEAHKYSVMYEGFFVNSIKQGQGKLHLSNGEIFTGDFENDLINGRGKYIKSNQQVILGIWKSGIYESGVQKLMLNAQNQEIPRVWAIEDSAPFTFSQRVEGTQQQPQQPQQPQQSQQSQQSQQFIYKDKISELSDNASYIIDSNRKPVSHYSSSAKKEKLDLPSGKYYLGQILNQQMHGEGILYAQDGKKEYEGKFRQGQFHGYGMLLNLSICQEGELIPDDLRIETIKQFWKQYTGDFENGKKHGQGRYHFADKSEYSGAFQEDEIHGSGQFICQKYGQISGAWDHGKLVQQKK